MKNMRRKIIVNDPIHEVMDFGSDPKIRKAIKAVVDTRTFQRLRRISQLGLASFVFPGATHSRFSHSLGTAYLAHEVIEHLAEQECDYSTKINSFKLRVLLSALLHDIGHGPFSHSFEKVLEGMKAFKNYPIHENWTATIIQFPDSEICKAITQQGINPELIASPFVRKPKMCFPRYLKQIISSQIDVDRMDYLLRDSHHAGVSIGRIDIHYLINCLHIVEHGRNKFPSLGITQKGIKTYESYAIARQLMNRTIYYHCKVQVLEFMVETIIRTAIEKASSIIENGSMNNLFPKYLQILGKNVNKASKSEFKQDEFMKENLRCYVEMTEDSFWLLARKLADFEGNDFKLKRAKKYADMLLKRQVLRSFVLQPEKDKIAEDGLNEDRLINGEDFSIIALESTLYERSDEDPVFVEDREGRVQDISKYSELISAFQNKPEIEKVLIVLDSKKEDRIEKTLKSIQVI